jgi:periplasmic copper chaperone A
MKKYFVLFIALIFVLSACATPSSARQDPPIEVTNAWVRTVGGMGNMSSTGSNTALFMTIKNNSRVADKLLSVESDVAQMVQIHLSEMDANGVSSMHEVDGVDIPAGGTTELKPGSYHVMIMGLQRDLKEGDKVTFTLTFQNAGKVMIEAPVKTP